MASGFKWSPKSAAMIAKVHPKLQKIANRAIELTPTDMAITCGLRTVAEQRECVRRGVSKTMKSNHITGRALDYVALINGQPKWDEKVMTAQSYAWKAAAKELGISIVWGGDWKGSWDKSHIELARSEK